MSGPYTAQVANVATSEAEAIALLDKAKVNGFIVVKFYGTLTKDWLPAAAAEAHNLQLQVHSHIPSSCSMANYWTRTRCGMRRGFRESLAS